MLVTAAAWPLHAEPSQADRTTARDLMREGKSARLAGDHAGAARKFQGAYALVPTPVTALALARELMALGRLIEARELLGAIGRMPVSPKETGEGAKARAEASALLVEVTAKLPVLELSLRGAPAGAAIALTIDDASTPLAAVEAGLRLDPGAHAIVVRVDGKTYAKTITLAEGARESVAIDVTPVAPPPLPAAATPAAPPVVTIARPSPSPRRDDEAPSRTARWVSAGAIGVGVVGMGIGGLLGLSAKST